MPSYGLQEHQYSYSAYELIGAHTHVHITNNIFQKEYIFMYGSEQRLKMDLAV